MYYRVTFIDEDHNSLGWLMVRAKAKKEAYSKAYEQYLIRGWRFRYEDMIAEQYKNRV